MNFPHREKFNLVAWSEELDLDEFYREAALRGFENNSNRKILVDSFEKERQKSVWMLYYDSRAVGSVAVHSLDILGERAYRICARTCVFTDMIPINHVRTRRKTIQEHQNITAQFYIPKCIEWAGTGAELYISTNESPVASQRLVHRIYCPALMETGAIESSQEIFYRGHMQTFWKLNSKVFLEQLDKFGRW
jgi:hypothetical protein